MSIAPLNPSGAGSMSLHRRGEQMLERIVEACHLVESRRSVRGVYIVARGQPTGDDLRRYQDCAAGHHVSLTVDTHGMISIRPGAGEDA